MRQPPAPRVVALEVLQRVDAGAYSNLALPAVLGRSSLSVRDRAFVTDLVYGTLRAQGRIDTLLARFLDRPLGKVDPAARAALRLGVYQLLTGVPAHAAVGETVEACAARFPRARGFVNAVLRRVAEDPHLLERPAGESVDAVAARTSMPPWIVDAARTRFAGDSEGFLVAMNEPPMVTLRAREARDVLISELQAEGIVAEAGTIAPWAVLVRGAGDLAVLPAIQEGRATPQDQGSQAVVAVVGAQPGERILDVGAAPGGKSTALAEQVGPHGLVVGVDVDPGRLRRLAMAVDRLGLPWCTPVVADGRALPIRGTFDRVVVDAPCTGLGVLRRRAEARWRIRPSDVEELVQLQRELLVAAAPFVRPGGRLVYSVCTWTPEETDAVADWALAELPEFRRLEPPGPPWEPTRGGALLTPMACDAMFVAVFERTDPDHTLPGPDPR